MSKAPKDATTSPLCLVVYADGSARPTNPGFGGYGLFGYTYRSSPRPKNVNHPVKAALKFTPNGVGKEKSDECIEVVDIYHASVAIKGHAVTNNMAELKASLHGLKWALQYPEIAKVRIITDSAYFVSNFNKHLDGWASNGFKKLDGTVISNVEVWGEIELTKNLLLDKGVEIDAAWVKGHSDDYGNELADTLSVIASNAARIEQHIAGADFNEVVLNSKVPYAEYKKSYDIKDIVYYFKDLFFSSAQLPDEDHCFLSATEDETNTGRRTTSAIFAVNQGSVPEVINKLKKFYRAIPRSYVCNCSIRLNKFDNKDILRLAQIVPVQYLLLPISKSANQYSLIGTDKVFLQENTMEYPFIVNISKLTNTIVNILSTSDDNRVVVDLTDRFIRDAKLLISNKDKHIDLSEDVEGKIKFCQRPLLGIGYDVPNYLTLKSIDTDIQSTQAVFSKSESSNFYTLYTKIITNDRTLCSINMVDKYLAVV